MDGSDEDDRLSRDEDWIEEGNEDVLIYGFEENLVFESLEDFLSDLTKKTDFNLLHFLHEQAKDEYEIIQIINFFRKNIDKNDLIRSIRENVNKILEKQHLDNAYFKPVLENDQLLQLLPDLIDPETDDTAKEVQDSISDDGSVHSSSASDSYYFKGYGEKGIHETMLKDKQRNDAYYFALEHSAKNKIVLDVGSGTGILSLFAIMHGATFVIAIENSNIVYTALQILFTNDLKYPELDLKNKILILKGRAEELSSTGLSVVHKPEHPLLDQLFEQVSSDATDATLRLKAKHSVDIVVSEWMGYGLFFEGMLDSVIDVRNSHLKEDGLMIPASASLFLEVCKFQEVDLQEIHGLDFSCLSRIDSVNRALVDQIPLSDIVSERKEVAAFALGSVETDELTFETDKHQLKILHYNQRIESFLISFDCRMIPKSFGEVVLSTSASNKPTHWAQTVLYPSFLKQNSVVLREGDSVSAKIVYRRQKRNKRNLNIILEVEITTATKKHSFLETFLLS